jgi:hypothetical protein
MTMTMTMTMLMSMITIMYTITCSFFFLQFRFVGPDPAQHRPHIAVGSQQYPPVSIPQGHDDMAGKFGR